MFIHQLKQHKFWELQLQIKLFTAGVKEGSILVRTKQEEDTGVSLRNIFIIFPELAKRRKALDEKIDQFNLMQGEVADDEVF